MTRLHMVRHAPTHARTMLGWTDRAADLGDTAALARLSAALPTPALLVSSDLGRAATTADRLSADRTRLRSDPRLREIHFGAWEDRSYAEIEAGTPNRIRDFWLNAGPSRAPGGETWHELEARVARAIDSLLNAAPDQDIIVVAHFGAILATLQRALGLSVQQAFAYRIEPLSLTRMTFEDSTWRVEAINQIL